MLTTYLELLHSVELGNSVHLKQQVGLQLGKNVVLPVVDSPNSIKIRLSCQPKKGHSLGLLRVQ